MNTTKNLEFFGHLFLPLNRKINKRGQFFLVAAVLIVGIVIGLSTATNSVKVYAEEGYVYDLGSEIKEETGFVMDNGVYYEQDQADLIERTKQFLIDYYGPNIEFDEVLFIYGDDEDLYGLYFNEIEAGNIGINTGSIPNTFRIRIRSETTAEVDRHDEDIRRQGYEKVSVKIRDIKYEFNLKDGQNFFLIIGKTHDGQKTVATE